MINESNLSQVVALGRKLLGEIQPVDPLQAALKDRLSAYAEAGLRGPEDEAGWVSCVLALTSVCSGNYGIGALIVDEAGRVYAAGHNEICQPRFRSDAHAEMVVLSDFELKYPNRKKNGLALYTSLEPCPMCYTRILISGLAKVFHVADDDPGGMAQRGHLMPEYWRAMESRCTFMRADVTEALRKLSLDILNSNFEELEHTLKLTPLDSVGGCSTDR